jgi:hypothetical protein
MDKSIVSEVVSTLEAVKNYGQPGFWILLVSILIVLVLVIAAVVYQRIVIARFQASSKATQDHLKALEVTLKEREVGVKEREELRETFTTQFSLVTATNENLSSEVQRLRQQQQGLEDSVHQAITLGLKEIENRLLQTTFDEMVSKIPENFKSELQKMVENTTDETGRHDTGSSLLHPAATPLGSLTSAGTPLIEAEILFRQPGSLQSVKQNI